MSAKTIYAMAAAVLVGGTLLVSAANTASAAQGASASTDHNVYAGHNNGGTAMKPEQKANASAAPYGYNDAPGDHAFGGGPG